jgi:hypothetical protein
MKYTEKIVVKRRRLKQPPTVKSLTVVPSTVKSSTVVPVKSVNTPVQKTSVQTTLENKSWKQYWIKI